MARHRIILNCESDPVEPSPDRVELTVDRTGAHIIVNVVGANVFVAPAALIIAALTLANDSDRDDLRERLNSLLHPGPR